MRVINLFRNPDLYQPVYINKMNISNNTNDINNDINFNRSITINKYKNMLKYSKYLVLNDTDKKYEKMRINLEESKIYLVVKRRMTKSQGSNGGNSNIGNNKDNKDNQENSQQKKNDEEVDTKIKPEGKLEFDIMKGDLSFGFDYYFYGTDFGNILKNEFPIFKKPIPIIGILKLVLDPEIKLGFYIGFEFKTHMYKQILNTSKWFHEVKNDYEDDEEDDTKLSIKLVGKGECSLSVGVGIAENFGTVEISFLAGINGLLGSGEIGFSLDINFNKWKMSVDSFLVLKAFYISLFLKLKIEIDLKFYKFSIEIYIFKVPFFGEKFEKHKLIIKKLSIMYISLLLLPTLGNYI